MQRVITLPNGRQCSLAVYVKAWRALLEADPEERIAGFSYSSERAADILREMRYGMHDRINRHLPGFGCGRKWKADYQIRLARDAGRLRDIARRIRVYQFESSEARSRFSHLLASPDDL